MSQISQGQELISDPFFENFQTSWEKFNSVDYSDSLNPSWWRAYDVTVDSTSSPIIGVSVNSGNPEFISTRLQQKLEPSYLYELSITYKELNSNTASPHWLAFSILNSKRFKPHSVKISDIILIPNSTTATSDNWKTAQIKFRNISGRYLIFGGFLGLCTNYNLDSSLILVSSISLCKK